MHKISGESANGTAVASGFVGIHLFELLIERGILGPEDGKAVLKKAHADIAKASRDRRLDQTLYEAEGVVSRMYASLQNDGHRSGSEAGRKPERCLENCPA